MFTYATGNNEIENKFRIPFRNIKSNLSDIDRRKRK